MTAVEVDTVPLPGLDEIPNVSDDNWHYLIDPDADLRMIVDGMPAITLCGQKIPWTMEFLAPSQVNGQGSGTRRRWCARCVAIKAAIT